MPKTIWCFIIGRDKTFSLTIGLAKTVGDLKYKIKSKKPANLKDIDAGDLVLYRVEVNEFH
jgi:hypothetical protein